MPISYTKEMQGDYILVHAQGTTQDTDDLIRYIDRFVADCVDCGTNRILLDHRDLMFDRKFAGTYDVAVRCTKRMSLDHPYRVALIARPERMEFARVYETIGLNRGVEIKAFERPKLAKVWLKSG